MTLSYKRKLKPYSRQLRSEMSDCEQLLWRKIRRKQILGVRFYRQKPIGKYIVDFFSNYPRIAIELDGGQHNEPRQRRADIVRDLFLRSLGIQVLRFSNLDVLQNCDGVLDEIVSTITQLKAEHPPSLLVEDELNARPPLKGGRF